MKILFFISSLRGGGAERVVSLLCNCWSDKLGSNNQVGDKDNIEVNLLTLDIPHNDFYPINNKVNRYWIGGYLVGGRNYILKRIYQNIVRLLRVRRVIASVKPDVVVSFMDIQNMVALMACMFTGIPVVISERSYPPYYNDGNFFDWLRKRIYQLSSAFVAQTNDVLAWARKFLPTTKIEVIPNPIANNKMADYGGSNIRNNHILAVGRLCDLKGFDLLIDAYYKCHKDYPKWRLLIVGEGEERKNLEDQIARLRLQEHVVLVGQTNNPEAYYGSAKIFVLSSRVEGFPNVLVEAMSHGLPVISFDCKSGPSDIIKNDENGLLVPAGDIDALSLAMRKLMADEALRQKLSLEAVKVIDRYSIDLISKKWLVLLKEMINERRKS